MNECFQWFQHYNRNVYIFVYLILSIKFKERDTSSTIVCFNDAKCSDIKLCNVSRKLISQINILIEHS